MKLISSPVLCDYIEHRKHSYRTLAEAVTRKGVPTSKATIGHLATGKVKRTQPARARAIAEVLDVPVRALFVEEVSTVQRDVPPTKKGKAA